MVSKNVYLISAWVMILCGLGLAAFGLYSMMESNGSANYTVTLIIVGLLLFLGGVIVYIVGLRKEKHEKQRMIHNKATKRTQINTPIISSGEQSQMPILHRNETFGMPPIRERINEPLNKKKVIRINSPPLGEVCMISKVPLASQNHIVQCPFCQAYFLNTYLTHWLKENPYCPVCRNAIEI